MGNESIRPTPHTCSLQIEVRVTSEIEQNVEELVKQNEVYVENCRNKYNIRTYRRL